MSMNIIHRVTLSNGQVIALEEGDTELHVGTSDQYGIARYICTINADGVLTYATADPATYELTEGLEDCEDPKEPL